ncbi:MAG TPA: S8 family serine peptidase [Verrucomicrobiae bacterium]|nr:S8 family serine peptidase [Verrucomicrobiae bacterium]
METRTDDAIARFGVTGQGVLVAIMDRGIDWRNDDFRNTNGATRIKYIFDLTDDTGSNAVGNTYGMGTIYTEAQINAALSGEPGLATRDAVGHGTAAAGIACGNGRNSVGQKYRGIAPDASIIVVKITSDGAPAHDDQPAEAPFFDLSRIPVAIDFVRDKARELGMPCVMTLDLGSQAGPTDGTSALCQAIDSTVGPGIPGLVFLTGAGDDGGMTNRAGGQVARGATNLLQITKGNIGSPVLDLWYFGNDRFDVTIQSPTNNYGPFISPSDNNGFDSHQTPDFTYYHYGSNVDPYNAADGKREIYMRLDGPLGTYTVGLIGSTVSSGRFDATLNPSQFWNSSANLNQFLNFAAPGNIWDGATAFNNICTGDYVVRTNYTDIDGFIRYVDGESVSNIWQGSSTGPTFDGRVGVDVCAPGDSVFTSYATNSYWHTFRFNLIQDGGGLYGRASATSAADPIVTGVVALMLQLNPRLDAPAVKSILQQSARTDSFTGPTPNPTWGYGKVDAYNALILAAPAPQITAVGPIGSSMGVSFTTVTGMNYRVEYTDSLSPATWNTLTNNMTGGSIQQAIDASATGLTQRFYRAVMFP